MFSHIGQYWRQFLDSLPESERPSTYYEEFHFGSSKESARQISQLVLQGIKTATGSLLWVYEADGKSIPSAAITASSQTVRMILFALFGPGK